MKKYEAKFTSEFIKWANYNWDKVIGKSCPIEVKVGIDDKPINFKSGFRPHQIPTLLQAKYKTHVYKISDLDRLVKPYDIALFCKADSMIAIHWVRKGNKVFYLIEPEEMEKLKELGHKSINKEMAEIVCSYRGVLK